MSSTLVVGAVPVAQRDFRAMGTDCTVLVYGDVERGPEQMELLADLAKVRVELLESLWSRFRADSELSRLNARAGQGPVPVSAETESLVRAMCAAWEATDGAFDPTVLAAVRANGYDKDFAELIATDALSGASFGVDAAVPGMGAVVITQGCVELPAGIGIDPGAIGKGLAADIVAEEMMRAGATGVLVDLGGDIAFAGRPGADPAWRIAVFDEPTRRGSGAQSVVAWDIFQPAGVAHAGVATSTSLTRRWADARHHVIDPATGASTAEALVQVTVSGGQAWECEVWATAALVRPSLVGSLPAGMSCVALSGPGPSGVERDDFRSSEDERTGEKKVM